MTTKLWRYDPITGYWDIARVCDADTAADWLRVFQADDALGVYRLSQRRPSGKPA
jgi:hypothetical protein